MARRSVRINLRLPEDTFLIGLIGRYHPMKDHANFLRAAGLAAAKIPSAHFVLVGRAIDQNNRELHDLVERMGLTDRVHLLGECENTAEICAGLDVFALSSYDESCPNVIGEAMACGVPCVVTDVGDARQIIGNTGRVIPPRNSEALAAAWMEMFEIGPEGRNNLGLAARERVVQHFAIDKIATRYADLYRRVIAQETRAEAADTVTTVTQFEEQPG
jgi:glycosyltransferase involved in cell wall biosynthesis